MSDAQKHLKMAEELRERARSESNPYTQLDFENAAQIYSVLAQRALADEGAGASKMVSDGDARGLQQQILQHFTV
jgi:hypothetical protein